MSNPYKKLRRKQYNLETQRREYSLLVDRLTRRVQDDNQILEDCKDVKIESPLDPKIFERLMLLRLEDMEWQKWELEQAIEKKAVYDNTADYCTI
jgi:hypothetical protein